MYLSEIITVMMYCIDKGVRVRKTAHLVTPENPHYHAYYAV